MRKVVVNSTPLLVLGNIDKLSILNELYGTIYITEAVYREVLEKNDKESRAVLASLNWITVMRIDNPQDYAMYRAKLHAGEVETMILAQLAQQKSFQADLVILDDLAARKTAQYLGLTVTGTLGVLIKAKQKGIISEVKPLLDMMMKNGFFISEKVMNMVLKAAGE